MKDLKEHIIRIERKNGLHPGLHIAASKEDLVTRS